MKEELLRFGQEHELSKREVELASLAYRCYSAQKIGNLLFIAQSTVAVHLKNIYRKLGIHSREELAECIDAWLLRESGAM